MTNELITQQQQQIAPELTPDKVNDLFSPDFIYSTIESSVRLQPSTKKAYIKTMQNFFEQGYTLTDPSSILAWLQGASTSAIGFLKAVVKRWAKRVETILKASSSPQNVAFVLSTIHKLEATYESIETRQQKGQKTHTWLTGDQVKALRLACDKEGLQGTRNTIVIGLGVLAGLRRDEIVNLKFSDLKKQGDRYSLQVLGKGAKLRTVPIKAQFADLILDWQQQIAAPDNSRIARAINKAGVVQDSLSGVSFFRLVRAMGKAIGQPELSPHDLRRTYARLGFDGGINIAQISKLLGHSNVATTQRYLGIDVDLDFTASDIIPF